MRNFALRDFGNAPFDIIDGDRGKNYPKQNEFAEEGHCIFLNATNVTKSGFDFADCQYISEQKDEVLRKGKLRRGDVVLTTRGTIGNSAYYSDAIQYDHMRINSGMVILRCDSANILPPYLYHYLRSPVFLGQVNSLRSGVAQPQLPIRDMKRIKLPLPSLNVQNRISSILSSYDDLIENNRRRMALLEESARQLYREWFVRLRFPGHEHTRILNGVPKGWEKVPTPEAIEINPRTQLSSDDEHWAVEMSDLTVNSMVIHQAVKREGRSGSKFRNRDTLFARITPCLENGKTAFVDFLEEGVVARGSTEFIVLRSKRLTPEFVYCLSRTYDFRENAIKSMVGSSGRQRVQESCFDKFPVFITPHSIVGLFTDSARPIFQQVKGLHAQNQKLRTARDLLLPKLMSGEIAV